ncbi:MAG: hypothetical protein VCC68_12940 [Myxococcota bacterium]
MQGVVPQPAVAKLLQDHFVALASDIDAPEDELVQLLTNNMPDAMMLPFVVFTDAEGNWVGGGQGAVHPDRFVETLEALVDGE